MKLLVKNILILAISVLFFACGGTKIDQQVVLNQTQPVKDSVYTIPEKPQVLVFTKTSGFNHGSIETGIKTLKQLGIRNDFQIVSTDDASEFNTENLANYQLVLFLNTTGDVLNSEQQGAFETYIQSGGSFMGIHSATDTEQGWPWYGKLVGAYFVSHPKEQRATIQVIDGSHMSTSHLSGTWSHFDEWYDFKDINPDIHVLLKLDESTYTGGKNGDDHPIAWYHEYDGGRAFYTGLGHTEASYDDLDFRKHLIGAINWCLKR
ncbi:ThuA domain-containing protein [Cellulophaga baltica]|uniref:ThuA domain-containing protein n=1 Tax=Cellulophaga TaxID=104264 RepID=UPI001C07955E|nr:MULTISPECIES: ThuA domain-containing protein [Cellulophaga]MBU2997607.1 ThuA domain-containing protein [Cellulophaga baltica]MDO6769002.1 ThuA domain-containing protein [Cellulophaga sp. 1_MG-2023]